MDTKLSYRLRSTRGKTDNIQVWSTRVNQNQQTLARIIWNATEYLLYIYICLANGRGAERERKKFQILPATAES